MGITSDTLIMIRSSTPMSITSSALPNIAGATSVMTTTNTLVIADIGTSTQTVRSMSAATNRFTSANMIFNVSMPVSTASVTMTTSNFPGKYLMNQNDKHQRYPSEFNYFTTNIRI